MRTVAEIQARIRARQKEDFFGFETGDYLEVLTFEQAKEFLRDDAKPEDWPKDWPKSLEAIRTQARDYVAFAWDKANNCRGLSAQRSLSHFCAWLWLLNVEWCDRVFEDYHYYGKPMLEKISDYFLVDWKTLDDGIRTNTDG